MDILRVWIIVLALLGNNAWGQFEDFQFESKLAQTSLDLNVQKSLNEAFKKRRLQQVTWILLEMGEKLLSDELELYLRNQFENSKVVSSKEFDGGVAKTLKVDLENGLKGVFKPEGDPYTIRGRPISELYPLEGADAEVAAYELDQLIELNLVPLTIKREVDGQMGSLQFWMDEATDLKGTPLHSWGSLFRYSSYSKYPYKIWKKYQTTDERISARNFLFFDWIIMNPDRHYNNTMWLKDEQRPVAIDHNLAFHSKLWRRWDGIYYRDDHLDLESQSSDHFRENNYFLPTKRVLNNYLNSSDDEWEAIVLKYFDQTIADKVLERKAIVDDFFHEVLNQDSTQFELDCKANDGVFFPVGEHYQLLDIDQNSALLDIENDKSRIKVNISTLYKPGSTDEMEFIVDGILPYSHFPRCARFSWVETKGFFGTLGRIHKGFKHPRHDFVIKDVEISGLETKINLNHDISITYVLNP